MSVTTSLAATVLAGALALPVAAAAAAPAADAGPVTAAASSTTRTAAAWPTLRQGSAGADVRTAQRLLREMQALASPTGDPGGLRPDGRFGPRTRHAVLAFQRRYGLTGDGVIGPRTWRALVVTVGPRSTRALVLAVQEQLRAVGYDLAADGVYGPRTRGAVRELQGVAGLGVTGVVDERTWRSLLSRSRG